MGYMYYCGGTLAGPVYEYKDYITFIEKREEFAHIPNTILPTLKRFSTALCKLLNFITLSFHECM